ncbi:urease accessory protein UreD [Algiphilus sp. W345]|uniref:Urease accessory protein UreD n=1 Tax=Banduia mediterranea TaxID=3075609 RepID=A0ABU2WKY2_9GAMM|nr:urease accessory protein UreD [Algiphilus sp. W345]MDT0498527.1 urease accessory protein UreD [Algiphilus sp. W345]
MYQGTASLITARAAASSVAPTVRAQRVDGATQLRFRRARNARTELADLYQRAPCRLLFPDVEHDEIPQAVLLTTSGGLTGGDRLRIGFEVEAGARACLSTQAAEKIYRAIPGEAPAEIVVSLRVGESAWAEWLAQETILFDRSRLRRCIEVDLAPGARLLAVESLVLGRGAMGETYAQGYLHESWRVRRDGRLIWADALHWDEGGSPFRPAFGFGEARACATLLYASNDAAAQLSAVREQLAAQPGIGAAGVLDGLLIVRLLSADAAKLRAAVMNLAAQLRHGAGGLPPRMPRVWTC